MDLTQNANQRAKEFRLFIEKEVLALINNLCSRPNVDEERIRSIARLTMNLIKPGLTLNQLYQNAVKLDDQFLEMAPVVFKIMKEYEEKYEKKALTVVSQLVRQGQYDQAQTMVKKVLQFKIFG